MKIILLIKIKKLGDVGDIINVKNGYARNFLIPKKKAVFADQKNIDFFLEKKREKQKKLKEKLIFYKKQAKKISSLKEITFKLESSSQGKLFGSIGSKDIVKKLLLNGIKISKNNIRLPKNKLRNIGKYKVLFNFNQDLKTELTINIISK